ncbi:nitroreductase family protein [Ferrimonas marina]|nr:nitroreductase family protein [Ferrimonas marina]
MSEHFAAFAELVQRRRSVRKFDEQRPFDHDAVGRALELSLLSPNSSNMQLWQFHRVISLELRAEVARCCLNQNAAATARELVVIVTTPQHWQGRAEHNARMVRENFAGREDHPAAKRAFKYYEKLIPTLYNNDALGLRGRVRKLFSWFVGLRKPMVREVSKTDLRVCLHKSTSLAAMTLMTGLQAEGIDSCPMEGYDSKRLARLLQLAPGCEITMVIGCGHGLEEGIYGERHRVPSDSVILRH